jgi:hypothetical protein
MSAGQVQMLASMTATFLRVIFIGYMSGCEMA